MAAKLTNSTTITLTIINLPKTLFSLGILDGHESYSLALALESKFQMWDGEFIMREYEY